MNKRVATNALNLKGKRFGKLTAIKRAGRTKNDNALWMCKCDCGNKVKSNATSLRRGDITSCGCERKERIKIARKTLEKDKTIDGVKVPLLTKKVRSDSKSGHKGVHKRNRKGKIVYEVKISLKGIQKHIGTFKDLDDAIKAREEAEKKYHHPYIKKLKDRET